MKITINGVAITPEIMKVLSYWYNCQDPNDIMPRMYVQWLSRVQDYLTRIWVDIDDDEADVSELRACVDSVIQIKDELEKFYI
jgi:hypothetical protein